MGCLYGYDQGLFSGGKATPMGLGGTGGLEEAGAAVQGRGKSYLYAALLSSYTGVAEDGNGLNR